MFPLFALHNAFIIVLLQWHINEAFLSWLVCHMLLSSLYSLTRQKEQLWRLWEVIRVPQEPAQSTCREFCCCPWNPAHIWSVETNPPKLYLMWRARSHHFPSTGRSSWVTVLILGCFSRNKPLLWLPLPKLLCAFALCSSWCPRWNLNYLQLFSDSSLL